MYPLIANFSWDQVLYYLIPLIWVLQYFLPGNKKAQDSEQPDTAEQREAAEAAQERMRKIREEIRRRVEAQRGESAEAPRPVVVQAAPAPAPPTRTLRPEALPQRPPLSQPAMAERLERSAVPTGPYEDLQEKLREQQARLAESTRARDEALKQTQQRIRRATQPAKHASKVSDLRSEVLATLKCPVVDRKAIVLNEILGKPRAVQPYN